ncbi:MAG: transglycosylase SLT domain-containing protein [Parahaliea sp.]
MRRRAGVMALLLVVMPLAADERALYQQVADYVGVRGDVLYAMAQAESGRAGQAGFAPWPWTLNIEGEPHYYDSREAMFDALMVALRAGRLRVDVGPMQVNWYWHHRQAVSPWRLTDPVTNIKLAAQFLNSHYQQTGDWQAAVGRYHRPATASDRDRRIAQRYRERVWRFLPAGAGAGEGSASHE